MKEIYTDLEKPEIESTTFNIKLEKGWLNHLKDVELKVGEDIAFIGEPKQIEKGYVTYTVKLISDKAKKLFMAE